MKSLFLRIFLSFWVAMVLIIAGTVTVTTNFEWRRMESFQKMDPSKLADSVAEALRTKGRDALTDWIRDREQQYPGLNFYLIDESGKDVTGRVVPSHLEFRVRRLRQYGLLSGPDTRPPPGDLDPFRAAPRISAPDGSSYTLMMAFYTRTPFQMFQGEDVRWLLLAIALIVSGPVCWWLARYVSRPVAKLQAGVRALAAGDLDARVGSEFKRRHDELSVLARDFDQMAEQLRSLISSKETLLRDVSHELRTPLARLRVALGLARRPGADLGRELDRIEREAERLDELIGQILHLSRLTSAQPILARERFDLNDLVSDVVDDACLEAEAQSKSIVWRPQGSIGIEGDQQLLRSAVENVVRNAVRFAPPGTAVEVTLTNTPGNAALTIRDHGPGVKEPALAHIFEPFYRVAEARDRDSGGFGIGLAITARVSALHGGAVQAKPAPGGGLAVTITLPAAA